MDHSESVSYAVAEMLAADAMTLMPPGVKPLVVSPIGVVPKRGTDNPLRRWSTASLSPVWWLR